MMKNKRIFYYDALRAMAIIGIVFCHASISFVTQGINRPDFYIAAFFDCFRDFSIPIFVMLSGALLINRRDSLKDFFKKRLSRIFIPFVFWAVLYIIYSAHVIDHGFSLSRAIDIFFGTSSTIGVAFWFIWMIVIVYFLIFIINQIIAFGSSKTDSFDRKFLLILTALSVIYIALADFNFINPMSSKIAYFTSFITYIIIGYFIANNGYVESRVSAKTLIAVTLLLSVGLYFYYIFGFVVPRSVSANRFVYMSYFNLLLLVMSVSIFLLFKYLSKIQFAEKIENSNFGYLITMISQYSFGIYLCHYLILHMLKRRLVRFYAYQSPLIWIPTLVILTLVISLIVLFILNRIPVLKRFSGKA